MIWGGAMWAAGLVCACTDASSSGDAAVRDEESFESLPKGALHFDGLVDYASTGTAGFPTGSAPQTISLWVNYASAAGTQVFISLRTDYASGVNVGIRDGEVEVWTVYGKGDVLVATPALPPAGVWHHIAFVFDRGDAGITDVLYVDGVVSASSTAAPDKLTPLSSWIGSLDGLSNFFAGDIDEIRIWNVARASSDIVQDMNGTTAPNAPGLVAYFDCNTIRGIRMPDDSGNGNDATLGGGDVTRMPSLVPSTVPQ